VNRNEFEELISGETVYLETQQARWAI